MKLYKVKLTDLILEVTCGKIIMFQDYKEEFVLLYEDTFSKIKIKEFEETQL